ncbi:uridine phosphorylase [Candidatus Geothermarchaeota archaeon]|nr:MAG: uridine phosphorylase [Candidatus Geothermarchaeota archaeon]
MSEKFISAKVPETAEKRQYHIALKPGDVSNYVLLPGDPDRVEKIAKIWDEARFVAKHREYVTYTGKYRGAPISAVSTGIGGPATAIAVEELARIGANTFIRVGTTGAIREEIKCGDLIISVAALRRDGTTRQYISLEYPAVANYEVVLALIQACEELGYRYHVGITCSTDSFYVGQARPSFRGFWQSWMDNIIPDLQRANVLNFEMESSTIFTLANLFGLRAGSICAVFANRVTDEFKMVGELEACKAACEAVRILNEWDLEKKNRRKRYWFPKLEVHKR